MLRGFRLSMVLRSAFFLLLFFAARADAQLVVQDTATGGVTPQDLVATLLGPDSAITVSNIGVAGDARCLGTFSGGNDLGLGALGFDAGVVLSSGRALDAVGPNSADDTTTSFGTPGDPFLDGLAGIGTFDACVLEFDFECPAGLVDPVASFQYAFGSEEYNEFVNSEFNNVFGFQLNGNNIGIIPGSANVPVAINNLNCGNPFNPGAPVTPNVPFCDLFINNDLDDGGGAVNIEADGLSVVLEATGPLLGGLNTIRLAIGDAGDSVLDTWVFMQSGSFQCVAPPAAGRREGC